MNRWTLALGLLAGSLLVFAAPVRCQTATANDGIWNITATTGTQTLVDGSDLTYTVFYAGNPAGNTSTYVTVSVGWNGNQYRLYGGTSIDVESNGKPILITGGKNGDSGYYRSTPSTQAWIKAAANTNLDLTLVDGTDLTYSLSFAGNPAGSLTSYATVAVGWNGNKYKVYGGNSMEIASKGSTIKILSAKTGDAGTFEALPTSVDPTFTKKSWRFAAGFQDQAISDGTKNIYRLTFDGPSANFVTVNVGWDGSKLTLYGGNSLDVASYGKPITISSSRTGDLGSYTVVGTTKTPEDVNGDSLVNVQDAIQVLRAAVGLTP